MTGRSSLSAGFGLAMLLCVSTRLASAAPVSALDPFAPSSTGLRQIAEIMGRLGKSMGDVPPNIDRIALSQIKIDPREFSPGMSRYIQAQVEEVFRRDGRKTVVTSPELRTFRVISTDSSFKFSNTLPSMEDLWKLGDKLRVDGFIEGSCSKSADNDVILNLKVFRHRTGEVVWSASFVAGPNEKKPDIWNLDWSASSSVRIFPVKLGIVPSQTRITDSGTTIIDTLQSLSISQYAFEGTVSEAVTPEKWLIFSVTMGYGFMNATGGPDSLGVNFTMHSVKFGIELLGIFFRKANPDLGYWLGTYLGVQEFIPFLNKGHIDALTVGYKSRVSRHFTLGGGILFLPLNKNIRGTGVDEERFVTLEPLAYELTYLHYTF